MGILLCEPAIVLDVFACGLAEPEDLGDGFYRFTYYVKQKPYHRAGETENIIVSRLILPYSAIITARAQMSAIFGCYCGRERKMALAH